jgi:preprotein translocase subunit SecA
MRKLGRAAGRRHEETGSPAGADSSDILRRCQQVVASTGEFEPVMRQLSDRELRGQTAKLRKLAGAEKSLDDLMPEAFATVREAASRKLGQRPHDVQIMAAVVLHQQMLAEMRTGEGKTLTATLPAYLRALTSQGVHLATSNGYLARRDAGWMRPVFEFLGMKVGLPRSAASIPSTDGNHQSGSRCPEWS